jgi:hypothetical protein
MGDQPGSTPPRGGGDAPGGKGMSVSLPAGMGSGVYADFAAVWHSRDVFTLDFAALLGPTGGAAQERRAEVVARVRIPPSQVFEIMKALETQLSAWERESARRSDG